MTRKKHADGESSSKTFLAWGAFVFGLVGMVIGVMGFRQAARTATLAQETARQAQKTENDRTLEAAFDLMGGKPGSTTIDLRLNDRRAADGDLEAARRRIDEVLAKDPTNARAHRYRALYLRLIGKSDDAIAELTRAIALAADDDVLAAQSHNTLGAVLANQQKYLEASDHFREASKREPRNAIYLVNLANALKAAGKDAEATAAIEEARQIDPSIARPSDGPKRPEQ